jgi:hypothetical protein
LDKKETKILPDQNPNLNLIRLIRLQQVWENAKARMPVYFLNGTQKQQMQMAVLTLFHSQT